MKRALAVAGLLAILAVSAYGQGIKAKVPFEFMVAGATLPAGNYEFKANLKTGNMAVRNEDTGKEVVVKFMTRLAADRTTLGKGKVTFDAIGDKKYLETVWPGTEDGYLIKVTKEEHTHEVVTGS